MSCLVFTFPHNHKLFIVAALLLTLLLSIYLSICLILLLLLHLPLSLFSLSLSLASFFISLSRYRFISLSLPINIQFIARKVHTYKVSCVKLWMKWGSFDFAAQWVATRLDMFSKFPEALARIEEYVWYDTVTSILYLFCTESEIIIIIIIIIFAFLFIVFLCFDPKNLWQEKRESNNAAMNIINDGQNTKPTGVWLFARFACKCNLMSNDSKILKN